MMLLLQLRPLALRMLETPLLRKRNVEPCRLVILIGESRDQLVGGGLRHSVVSYTSCSRS